MPGEPANGDDSTCQQMTDDNDIPTSKFRRLFSQFASYCPGFRLRPPLLRCSRQRWRCQLCCRPVDGCDCGCGRSPVPVTDPGAGQRRPGGAALRQLLQQLGRGTNSTVQRLHVARGRCLTLPSFSPKPVGPNNSFCNG